MEKRKKVAALIVAGGRGERAHRKGEINKGPKQYRFIGNKTILRKTIENLDAHPAIDHILVVIHKDDDTLYENALKDFSSKKLLPPAKGGATRQSSVYAGLKALDNFNIDFVLVHDAVRPFVTHQTIDRVLCGLNKNPAILPAIPVFDTIKRVKNTQESALEVLETVDRKTLWTAQTPQGFHFQNLIKAHRKTPHNNFTDDCAIMEEAGFKVHIVHGNQENMKITTADDIDEAKKRMQQHKRFETRVGNGFDVHAFEEGNAIILGGVSIPHTKKLKGHSDADVGLHTITDALYGALAEGDIGSHFPPSDPQWKGAASDQFLMHACERVKARGGRIVHLDLTLMCEAPKIGPYRDKMREEIANICALPISRVAVKATTTEKLGFTGREEGIAAQATATIELPFEDDNA